MGYLGNQSTFTGSQNNKRISSIATAGQTLFTVNGGYNINQLDVYLNGVKLAVQRDFTAIDGTTVTLLSAASDNDILEFVVFENFAVNNVLTPDGDQTLTGNLIVTGSLVGAYASTAGVASFAQGLLGTPDITLNSLFINEFVDTKNGEFSGIVTARSHFDGNITGTAATFTGNVTIGGTLTYDDVTNIDSIGLITARSGIEVTGGGINISSGVITATSFYDANGDIKGVGIATAGGTVGTGVTLLDFRNSGVSTVTVSSGIATIQITGGGGAAGFNGVNFIMG